MTQTCVIFIEFADIRVRSQSQSPNQIKPINSSFFHGKFRKYSASLGDVNYILKVKQKEYPELSSTEFVSNQILQALGINVPCYYLVRLPENELCFVTKNFMSDFKSSSLVHIYHFFESGQPYDGVVA